MIEEFSPDIPVNSGYAWGVTLPLAVVPAGSHFDLRMHAVATRLVDWGSHF